MVKRSAGILLYRERLGSLKVFLVHPGGPFWAKKDLGVWSIPKGEYTEGEDPLAAALREFHEETGCQPAGDFLELGTIKQSGGKLVTAWAAEGDCNPLAMVSNTCEVEWPPRSGRRITIPEVDRAEWFAMEAARDRILKGQLPFLDMLLRQLPNDRNAQH